MARSSRSPHPLRRPQASPKPRSKPSQEKPLRSRKKTKESGPSRRNGHRVSVHRTPAQDRSSKPEGHWIPGERAVAELMSADPSRILAIYVDGNRSFPEVQDSARRIGIPIKVVEREWMEQIVGVGLARGIIAQARPPRFWDLRELLQVGHSKNNEVEQPRDVLVALDEVIDPQNLGAILRSAEFFGVQGVIWTRDRSAPLSATAVRASAGASERIKMCVVTNLATSLEYLKQQGWWVVGCVAQDGQSLATFQANGLPPKLVVVLGSEQRGLRRLTRKCCDYLVTIEGRGMIGSLNVSTAAAVVIEKLA